METLKSIVQRRSVRKFSDKPVDRETINDIIEVTRFYPSWKNSQAMRFYVMDNPKLKLELASKSTQEGGNNYKIITHASAVLVLAIKKGLSGTHPDGVYVTKKKDTWEMFDAGIAAQTFSLAAFEMGIGSVILGMLDEDEVAKVCALPNDEEVAVLIAFGYPLDPKEREGVRKPVEEILKYL